MKKILSSLLLLVMLAVMVLPTAVAAGVGSISFIARTTGDHVIVPDAEFQLYRLADYDIKTLTPTEDFSGIYLTPDRIRTDMVGCIETVEGWLDSHTSIQPMMVMISGESGTISFTGLSDGIYMVRYKQDEVKDEKYVRKVDAESVIIAIPYANGNEFLRDVNITPKITVTPLYEPVTVSVTKRWDDKDNRDRPKSVTVGLFEGETQIDEQTLTVFNNWSYSWSDLDSRKSWDVKEINTPEGYEVSIEKDSKGLNYIITNTLTETPPTDLKVTKVWTNDLPEARPTYVELDLVEDDKTVLETVRLDATNKWTAEWTGLDPEKTYTFKEKSQYEGYTTTIESRIVNNTLEFIVTNKGPLEPTPSPSPTPGPGEPGGPTLEPLNITVKKVWVGRTIPVAVKPIESIEPGSQVTPTPPPQRYSYEETTPEPQASAGFDLRKALSNIEDVTFDMTKNTVVYITSEGRLDSSTNSEGVTFFYHDGVYVGKQYDDGSIELADGSREELNDEVPSEPAVTPEVVYMMVDGEFVAVHNTPIPEGAEEDTGDSDTRSEGSENADPSPTPGPTATPEPISNEPMSVVIGLFENGKQVQAVELSDGNYWEYSWTGLDRSKEWTVQELNVPTEYEATVLFQKVDDNNYVFTVTNSRITPIDISAKKVWEDDENPERPLSVSVALFRDGVQLSDGVTLSSGNEWTTTWTGLNPKGEYTVKEINCPKEYTPAYTRDGNTFIVTNKLLPKAQADVVTGSDFPWYLYLALAVVLLGGGGFGIWYVLKRRRSA